MAMLVPSNSRNFLTTLIICSFLLGCCSSSDTNGIDEKVYVVYMGHRPEGKFNGKTQHLSILQSTLGSKRATESWMHSYDRSFNGFVAKLTEEEKNEIAGLDEVVSVFPNTKMQLHTTRSWDFIGLPLQSAAAEDDVIVCVLDTGIWPENPSFDDTDLGPPPARWNGICESSSNFTCNNKIIGARFYNLSAPIPPEESPTPRDMVGHGSHTASTAAGRVVPNASMIGLARGTARGGVPNARIGVYKVCWGDGCYSSDILQGFNDAIQDNCDMLSVSLGGNYALPHYEDPIAIGAYHAMQKGILTSNSAGNDGPTAGSVTNVSPWSITVAANVIDRKFRTKVELGNNKTYEGVSINTFTLEEDFYPLVYGGDVPAEGYEGSVSRYCVLDSLDPELVKGKIVLCDRTGTGNGPAAAQAIGSIMDGGMVDSDYARAFPLPASIVNTSGSGKISSYIRTTSEPLATIYKSFEYNETRAPFVVSFSSRGPNTIDPEVLKPDITAPGVDILAAWSDAVSPTDSPLDPRIVEYNIISGTSMSCPHVTGAAAYVKSFNPTWSPSAIKSALMTTATPMTLKENKDGEFAYGAGQINPLKAKAPGLIYEMVEADYVSYLCGQGYSRRQLQLITGDNTTTCNNKTSVYDFNYPALVVSALPLLPITRTFHRTVTNVGTPSSTYRSIVTPTKGLNVVVSPKTLSFESIGDTETFKVTVRGRVGTTMMHSMLIWGDGNHTVRSPIVFYPRSLIK